MSVLLLVIEHFNSTGYGTIQSSQPLLILISFAAFLGNPAKDIYHLSTEATTWVNILPGNQTAPEKLCLATLSPDLHMPFSFAGMCLQTFKGRGFLWKILQRQTTPSELQLMRLCGLSKHWVWREDYHFLSIFICLIENTWNTVTIRLALWIASYKAGSY